MGALYYFFINPYILNALEWFANNIEFSFILGTFFGLFIVDITYSFNLVAKIRAFAKENDILIKYEELKQNTFTWIGTSSNPLRESPYGGPTVTYCNKKE